MEEALKNWQQKPFKETLSKRRKKQVQEPTSASLARSQITKSRNRLNAELDRYKRRLLFEYLKCLPYLSIKQNQSRMQAGLKNGNQCRPLNPEQPSAAQQFLEAQKSNSDPELRVREAAMQLAIDNFVKFHNLHIIEKPQENQQFTLQSIRPEIRKQFMSFIKKLLSYSNQQLFQMDQKSLLDHSISNPVKNQPKQPIKRRTAKKDKSSQSQKPEKKRKQQKQPELALNSFPVIILFDEKQQKTVGSTKLDMFNKNAE